MKTIEAAEILGTCTTTIGNLIRSGQLNGRRDIDGHSWIVDSDRVNFFAQCYTINDVVRMSHFSRSTIYRDIRLNRIKAHKLGGKKYITPKEFKRWIHLRQ